MDIDNFGKFFVEWNNGVANHWLKTTSCDYNGTWHFNIKTPYRLIGIDNLQHDKLKENMQDCDVACFGDSATYGQFLKDSETWPAVLKSKTGLDVRNYGVYSSSGMSNFNQIFAIMEKFLLTYKAKHIFVLLPPSFKKQIKINGNIVNAGEWHPDTYHYCCNNESHQLALIISQIDDFLNQHHNKSNIYFSTTYNNDNLLFRRSKLSRYFLDFVDPDQYDKLDSIRKHFDQKYCLDFAENLCKIIKYT